MKVAETASIIQHKRYIFAILVVTTVIVVLDDHHRHEEKGIRIVIIKCKGEQGLGDR